MFTIFGAGFGLYGYLPALVECTDEPVILPATYRERFEARTELKIFADRICWVANHEEALAAADGVVVALSPDRQPAVVQDCLQFSNVKRMILEKPLAPDPALASQLLATLTASGKNFRIGYNFRHTAWGQRLLDMCKERSPLKSLSLHWSFLAHHFRHDLTNWKRRDKDGGGALRFYGIHVLALLAEAGYEDVRSSEVSSASPLETEKWNACLIGPNLPDFHIHVDSRSAEERFFVAGRDSGDAKAVLVDLGNPFSGSGLPATREGGLDERITIVQAVCRSLLIDNDREISWYERSIQLWSASETVAARQ